MKRKPAGSNHKVIDTFLMNESSASAAQIKRATKVKGNIYVTLNKMVALGLVKKVGTKYSRALAPETQSKPEQAKFQPHPNAEKIGFLLDEIDHVSAGIQTLQATLNYLNRRAEQLTEQKF
jgi:hypothetical protein